MKVIVKATVRKLTKRKYFVVWERCSGVRIVWCFAYCLACIAETILAREATSMTNAPIWITASILVTMAEYLAIVLPIPTFVNISTAIASAVTIRIASWCCLVLDGSYGYELV